MRDNFMKKICFSLVFLFVLFFSFGANAATFKFQFDDYMDGSLGTNNWLGAGTFEFADDVVDKSYSLEELYNRNNDSFSFDFTFTVNNKNIIFTESDINTDYAQVKVIVFDSKQQIRFEEYDTPNGIYGGSIEFDNDDEYLLTFGPSNNPMNYILAKTNILWEVGDYGTMNAVPIPAAVWLLGSGLAGLAVMRRKSKK